MYCDCVLAKAGFQSGYIAVFLISAVFVVAALAVMVGGFRTGNFHSIEAVKEKLLEGDD